MAATLEQLDADRVASADSPLIALRRRLTGRYSVDPFGLDPQVADALLPVFTAAVRVRVSGGENVPVHGGAIVVANRGFGIAEPAALAGAVREATGRRLRVIGAPAVPFLGSATRRLGAIAATEHDVMSALKAGHLVGVPLAPTWLRTGAGDPPLALATAMTHNPIIPAAVTPIGRFGSLIGAWRVRFGTFVTLPEHYEPDDPIAAARLADAMRAAVGTLLMTSDR